MRDSTWHRVGLKNEKFILRRRDEPNGVHVGGSGSDGGGGGDGGGGNDDVDTNTVYRPFRCQPDSDMGIPATPTYRASAEANDDGVSGIRDVARPSELKTPEARSSGPSESFGERSLPQRSRGGSATGNTTRSGTHDNGGRRDDGNDDPDARRRTCVPRTQGDGERDFRERFVERQTPYRIQLSLSAQQREAAARMGFGLAPEDPAGAAGDGDDVVTISCSADDGCDMYQLGRMEGGGNDFAVRGPLHQSKPGGKVCGPVSRYAVRLLVDRAPPYRCRIFTGGFNSR